MYEKSNEQIVIMRKFFLLKVLFKIFLLSIIPIALISYMILTEISFSGVLAIVAYFQFLLIWAQAEIGLKQHALFASQFDPFFQLILTKCASGAVLTHINIAVKNTSNNPAYHVFVSRIFEANHEPIYPKIWKDKLETLSTKDLDAGGAYLFSINDIEFIEGKIIEITYMNKFGDFKEILIRINDLDAFLIPSHAHEPGILLNTFRELSLFFSFLRWEWSGEFRK
jgi:hypothetical protein